MVTDGRNLHISWDVWLRYVQSLDTLSSMLDCWKRDGNSMIMCFFLIACVVVFTGEVQ
jgi:hypothetical protein